MKHTAVFIAILMLFLSMGAYSRPVHNKTYILRQPDGSTFSAVFLGDEFLRLKTTSDGNAIIQGADGWWYYAAYDSDARKISTGVKVGENPPAVSREIPVSRLLSMAALKKRSLQGLPEESVLKRMKRLHATKSGDCSETPLTKHGIVILAQFADLSFKHTAEAFRNLLNQQGYNAGGAQGCAKEYFDAQFNGKVHFTFDVSSIVTLSKGLAAYGGNITDDSGLETDKAPEEMIIEACQLADDEIDFSLYDDDGDGEVDNVFVFFAGGDEAEGAGDDCVWSHAWYIRDGAGKHLALDGKIINRYACTAEMTRKQALNGEIEQVLAGIGTFCHEYSHTFGLADTYDTDYLLSGGEAKGLWGSTSLMDNGNVNNYGNTPPFYNAVEREMLGMSEPELIEGDGVYFLEPINESGRFYKMNTDVEGEFFLFECRDEKSWDSYIGGRGLLVYHVDRSSNDAGYSDVYDMNMTAEERWYYNEVNCRPDHECADLIEAVPDASNVANVFYPAADVSGIAVESLAYWSGAVGTMSVTDIAWKDGGISFNVIGSSIDTTPPEPVKLEYVRFQDAAIVSFESDRPYGGPAEISWGESGRSEQMIELMPYETGKYALVLEELEPRTSYTVNISFSLNGVTGKQGAVSFLTNTYNKNTHPYIYLKSAKRNLDGTFPIGSRLPLRVYNSVGAEDIQWTLDDVRIDIDETGYYMITKGGTLRASVWWEDGSSDVICKEIIIGE